MDDFDRDGALVAFERLFDDKYSRFSPCRCQPYLSSCGRATEKYTQSLSLTVKGTRKKAPSGIMGKDVTQRC